MAASFAALLMVGGSASAGGNPWNLKCASMPAEQQAPAPLRIAALRFFPWIRPAAEALHSGPVYLVALSSKTAISRDGDSTDSSAYYLHRALIAIAPSYQARVAVTGHRLGESRRRATLGFSTNGATACTVNPPDVSCGTRPLPLRPNSHHQPARRLADRADRTTDRTHRLLRDHRLRPRPPRRHTALRSRSRLRHHRLVTGRSPRLRVARELPIVLRKLGHATVAAAAERPQVA